MKQLFLPLILSSLVAALGQGCGVGTGTQDKNSGKKGGSKEPEGVPVEVMALERGPIESAWTSSTDLEAEEEVRIFSRTANRVTELLVEEGDVVEKGQVLLRLVSDTQKIALDKAQSNFDKAAQDFGRQESLYEQQLVSEEMFNTSQHDLRQLELSLADAQREFDYTEIRAAIGGTITVRMAKLGDHVTANQHLLDIIDFNSIVARVYPPEKILTKLSLKQSARVRAPALGDQVFPAYVKRIAPVVDARTGTIKVTLGFKDVRQLRPGLYVDAEIVLATYSGALLIPKRALVYDGDQTYVYRLGADRKVDRILVEEKLADKLHVTPKSGFEEGDQIVVAGQTGLKDGARVRLPGDPKPEEKVNHDTAKAGSS